jgi:hypothetical protein
VTRSAAFVQNARWEPAGLGLNCTADRATPSKLREVHLDARILFRATVLATFVSLCGAAGTGAAAPSPGPAPPRAPGARPPRAVTTAAPANGQKTFTMLYGDDHCFGLVAPDGWVLDDSSGLGSKIRVVMYPRGQKWATSPTVMYVNPIHQDPKHPMTLPQMIQRDVDAFRKQAPRGQVTVAPQVRTKANQTAEVRYFTRDGADPEEAVAYLPEKDLTMLIVLSSREVGGFKRMLPRFREMVATYQFVAGGIQTPTH